MAVYPALDVARWFLQRNQIAVSDLGGEKMTLMKLLKLLYYAEGCSLALDNGSLFQEEIVAWEHGPVVVSVYEHYPDAYNLPFGSEEDSAAVERISANTQDSGILEEVFQVFGQYSAWALRNKTHEEEPWLEATDHGRRLNGVISRKTMERYFRAHYVD